MVVTRFCPTANNGHIHIGHLLNAYVNLLWARKNNGQFFIKAEYQRTDPAYDAKELVYLTQNTALLRRLFPNAPIVTTMEAAGWVHHVLRNRLPGIDYLKNQMFISVGIDAIMGTTDIIRGRDWSACEHRWETAWWNAPEQAFFAGALLEKLANNRVTYHLIPVFTINGAKITKRTPIEGLTVAKLLERYHPYTLYRYIGERINLANGLDLPKLGSVVGIEVSLPRISWLEAELPNDPDNAYLAALENPGLLAGHSK